MLDGGGGRARGSAAEPAGEETQTMPGGTRRGAGPCPGTRGVEAAAIDGVPAIVDELAAKAEPGDVVLVMSNGEFGGLWTKLLDRLAASRA